MAPQTPKQFAPQQLRPHRALVLALLSGLVLTAVTLSGCASATAPTSTTSTASTTSTNTKDAPVTNKTSTTDTSPNIYNYLAYSDSFASAGQPTEAQLSASFDAGVERVIYLAFSDQERSLPAEDRIVKSLGMSYLQIPVDWRAPQSSEYYLFASAMQIEPERKTLLHCQANLRASAFAFLYRVLELDVPLKEAKQDMNQVWVPNGVWTQFILQVLKDNEVDSNCSGCDWTPSTIGD